MPDIIKHKRIGGTQVFVNGRFVGWKCSKCDASCPYKGQNKYDLCHYGEVVKGVNYSLVTPLGVI